MVEQTAELRRLEFVFFKRKKPRNRIGFDKMEAEMPFFKESMTISERLRQELNMVLQTGNQTYIDAIMNRIFNDTV